MKKLSKNISSYLTAFMKVLTKVQKVLFPIYLVGLLWIIKFRSIREIALTYGGKQVDRLHQFITGSLKKVIKLRKTQQQIVAQQLKGKKALLILDDTPCPREGDHIEGIGFHHGPRGLVKGLCAVTAVLKAGWQRWCWAIVGYRPKSTCPPGTFKSKVQLASEIIKEAASYFGRGGLTVLLDSWYACAPVLRPIQEAGWTFVAAIKQNRLVRLDEKKRSVKHLAKGLSYKTVRLSNRKQFRVAAIVVYLPKIGLVKLVICNGAKRRYLVTNNLEMTEREMLVLYAQRWGIETFHKEVKQFLGFGELFMRSWVGVQTHWTLVGIAYNLVLIWNKKSSPSFRQMLRHFRNSVSYNEILQFKIQ